MRGWVKKTVMENPDVSFIGFYKSIVFKPPLCFEV